MPDQNTAANVSSSAPVVDSPSGIAKAVAAEAAANTDVAQAEIKSEGLTRMREMPRLENLQSGRRLMERLTPSEKIEVDNFMKTMKSDAPLDIGEYGFDEQSSGIKALKSTTAFLKDDARIQDLGRGGELLSEFYRKLKELGVGDLKVSPWEKFLSGIPVIGKKIDELKDFREKYQKVGPRLNEILDAMESEKISLTILLRGRVQEMVSHNEEGAKHLKVVGASIEKKLYEKEAEVKKWLEEHKDVQDLDREEIREANRMMDSLEAYDRKLTVVKVMRQELLSSATIFDILRRQGEKAVEMLGDRQMMNRSIWTNQINIALMQKRLEGVVELLRTSEDFTNKLLRSNMEAVEKTVTELGELSASAGLDTTLLREYFDKERSLDEKQMQMSVDARKKHAEHQKMLDELDAMRNERSKALEYLTKSLKRGEGNEIL